MSDLEKVFVYFKIEDEVLKKDAEELLESFNFSYEPLYGDHDDLKWDAEVPLHRKMGRSYLLTDVPSDEVDNTIAELLKDDYRDLVADADRDTPMSICDCD